MNFKYNGNRARYLLIAFYILLAVTALAAVSNFMEYRLLSEGDYTYAEADSNDVRQAVVALLELAVYITVVVLFIMWFRRAYYNLHQTNKHMAFQEGWAAGAWFVPFLNLIRPYEIMREIWIDTQEVAQVDRRTSTSVVGWWWGIFIINNIIDNVAARLYNGAETIEDLMMSSGVGTFSDIFGIAAILVAVNMIQQTRNFEERMYRSNYEVPIEDHLI